MSTRVLATRREILRYGAGAAGALTLGALSFPATAADKKFNIALSNAYNGNEWRKQMAEACDRAAKEVQGRSVIGTFTRRSRIRQFGSGPACRRQRHDPEGE